MWSAVRLPRMEAFLIFLFTIMMVSLMMARNPLSMTPSSMIVTFNAPWLPFLMMLLPRQHYDDGDVCLPGRA
ncbi:hypothetical protein HR12_33015 [Microbacterium sp. SUBG005]|nr:hypothetical protein HR12_33015 [Microbacterium sp. SUBG005]